METNHEHSPNSINSVHSRRNNITRNFFLGNQPGKCLKARCGHEIPFYLLKFEMKCDICDERVTESENVEQFIKKADFKNISSLTDQELFLLFDNFIENESLLDFEIITTELKQRLNRADFSLEPSRSLNDLYLKSCAYGRFDLIKFFDATSAECCGAGKAVMVFATISGNMEMIKYLLQKLGRECINAEFETYYPIHMACLQNNLELFDFLVENVANLNVICQKMNLLSFVCNLGLVEFVKRLIEDHGFDPNQIDDANLSALAYTIMPPFENNPGLFKIIAELLKKNEKSENDCVTIAKYLLDHGAELDSSLITITGLYNREKVFDLFLDYSKNVLGHPLDMSKHQEILINISKNPDANLEFLEKVVKICGVDVNFVGSNGNTALLEACLLHNDAVCVKLIELGANVNVRDKVYGYPPLLHACKSENTGIEVIGALIEHGADLNATTSDGSNALHCAAKCYNYRVVEELLRFGFDPNAIDSSLNTPLHSCLNAIDPCEYNDHVFDVVKLLVEAGADVTAENEEGMTPVSIASGNASYDVEAYLNIRIK